MDFLNDEWLRLSSHSDGPAEVVNGLSAATSGFCVDVFVEDMVYYSLNCSVSCLGPAASDFSPTRRGVSSVAISRLARWSSVKDS